MEEEHMCEGKSYGGKSKIITQSKGDFHMDLTFLIIFFLIQLEYTLHNASNIVHLPLVLKKLELNIVKLLALYKLLPH